VLAINESIMQGH